MIDKIDFIAIVRHISWITYQIGAGQSYNEDINEDQLESLRDGVKLRLDNPDVT